MFNKYLNPDLCFKYVKVNEIKAMELFFPCLFQIQLVSDSSEQTLQPGKINIQLNDDSLFYRVVHPLENEKALVGSIDKAQAAEILSQEKLPFFLQALEKKELNFLNACLPELVEMLTRRGCIFYLPENWKKGLAKHLAQALLKNENAILAEFERHIGEDATYLYKTEIQRTLKFIYLVLMGNLSSLAPYFKLSNDQALALMVKATEDLDQCTPGFHNRLNEILQEFFLPKNVYEILTKIRSQIVSKAASQVNNEVHTKNRFHLTAVTLGFGVEVINKKDVYRGLVEDEEIADCLQRIFHEEYYPFNILLRFKEQLESVLSSLGYRGRNEAGYPLGDYGIWVNFLKEIFPDEPFFSEEVFILNENDNMVDLNWKGIYLVLWKHFNQKHYFNFSLEQVKEIQTLLQGNSSFNGKILSLIFGLDECAAILKIVNLEKSSREKAALDYLKKYVELNDFHKVFCGQNIHKIFTFFRNIDLSFTPKLRDQLLEQHPWLREKIEKNLSVRKFSLLSALEELRPLNEIINRIEQHFFLKSKRCYAILQQQNGKKNAALHLLIRNHPPEALKLFALLLQNLSEEEQFTILSLSDRNYLNSLMLALHQQSGKAAEILLDLILGWSSKRQEDFLLQNDRKNQNALLIALKFHPQLADKILTLFINLNIETQVLLFKNPVETNLLLSALEYQQEKFFLKLLALADKMDRPLKESLLVKTNKQGENLFLLAVLSANPAIFVAVNNFIKSLTPTMQSGILTHSNLDSDNILHLALNSEEEKAAFLINEVQNLTPSIKKILLKHRNKTRWNPCMLAIKHHPALLPQMVKLLKEQDKADLAVIFSQVNAESDNVLTLFTALPYSKELGFFKTSPQLHQEIFNLLSRLTLKDQAIVLKQRNQLGQNALMCALSNYRPLSFLLLSLLKKQKKNVREELLSHADLQGWNVPMLAVKTFSFSQPISGLLLSIKSFKIEKLKKIFLQKNEENEHFIFLLLHKFPLLLSDAFTLLEKLDEECVGDIFKQVSKKNKNNLVMDACSRLENLQQVTVPLNRLPEEDVFIIFSTYNQSGLNLLMLAKQSSSECFEHLLNWLYENQPSLLSTLAYKIRLHIFPSVFSTLQIEVLESMRTFVEERLREKEQALYAAV